MCTNMTKEKVLSVQFRENNADSFPIAVSILVVDCDSTCLRILSRMLQKFGCQVTTATRATDALRILREKQDEINLILTESHLPDMDQYEILETVREMPSLPVVVFSADDSENAMLGSLFEGAALYLTKPIIKNDVRNLWQLTYRKKIKPTVSSKGSNLFLGGSKEENASSSVTVESPLPFHTIGQSDPKGKRKEIEVMDTDGEDNGCLTVPKKSKLVWTNELHERFLQAIRILGFDDAHPKKILQHMRVPGLTKENVSSHLQKYRLSLKRGEGSKQKLMDRDHHPLLNVDNGGLSQYMNPQLLTTPSQSECRNNFQKHLHSPMSIHSIGSTRSLIHVDSIHNDISIPNYLQDPPQSNQLVPTYPNSSQAGVMAPTEGNPASIGQMGNHCVEEHMNQTSAFSNEGTNEPTALGNAQLQSQFTPLQLSPLPQPLPDNQGGSDMLDMARIEDQELLEMAKEFLEDANNDLWL